jgi:PAS domain S-box-containing protein
MLLVGKCVTELQESAHAAQQEAEDLRRMLDAANVPIIGVDQHGSVNEWNWSVAEITGYSKGEVMGRSLVDDFIHVAHQDSIRQVLMQARPSLTRAGLSLGMREEAESCGV